MATDWMATLREQGALANEMAASVAQALAHPNLDPDQASRIYRLVERGAQDFDRIVAAMAEHDVDETLHEAAETLEDIWSNLFVAVANKVRTMPGLASVEFPEHVGEED